MELTTALAGRRMCRDFLPDPLDPEVLERVLAAAFRAPAAGNTDALSLLVLEGPDIEAYWDVTLPGSRRTGFRWPGLLRAPVLAVPYVEPDAYLARYAQPDKSGSDLDDLESWSVPYWWVDGGAAVMAVLLAAESEGLGALLFGQFDHETAVSERFGVSSDLRAVGTLALGRAAPGGRSPSASASGGRPSPRGRIRRPGFEWAGARE